MIVLENEVLFSIFPVISILKPMKMVRTEFRGHYILLVANKTNKKGIFHALGCTIRSISNGTVCINNRSEFGHREIDTVKTCASSTVECALTLTERKTRAEIIRKMPNAKSPFGR